MSAEAWVAIAALVVTALGSAAGSLCAVSWRFGRFEAQLRAFGGHVAANRAEHAEFRDGITRLREQVARLDPRPVSA